MPKPPEPGSRSAISPAERHGRSWDTFFCMLAFGLSLTLYVATLAPSLLNDDPAEYQTLLPLLGVAHPTGYPLYTLLGYLFTRVAPVGDMALRVNLFSAFSGAAAVAVCYLLLRALSVSRLAALPGALAVAVASDSWTYATIAQTYALNTLLIGMALWGCVYAQRRHDRRSLLLLALTVGFGIAHHSTFWLLAPAIAALFVFDAGLRNLILGPGRTRQAAAALTALALPLTLYAYIPLRGERLLFEQPGAMLGVPRAVAAGLLTPHYLAGWTNVVLGSFYAASTLGGGTVDWANGFGEYLAALHAQFHGFEILALGLLAPPVLRRNRVFVTVLSLAWLANIVVVLRGVSAFNEPAGGLYTPTYLFCAVAMVLVMDSIARILSPRLPRLRTHLLSAAALAVIVLWSLLQNFPIHDPRSDAASYNFAFQQWASGQLTRTDLPRDAVVLGAWSEVTPLHYIQLVDGVRPDVIVLQAPLAAPAGRELIARALNEGRMTYLAAAQRPLMAVAFKDAQQPGHALQASFGGELTLLGYDLDPRAGASVKGGLSTVGFLRLYWLTERKPAADYKVFVHLLDAAGNQIAGADHLPVTEYFPTSSWPQGLYYVDAVAVPGAADLSAIEIGLYEPVSGKRLTLPDASTSVRIEQP